MRNIQRILSNVCLCSLTACNPGGGTRATQPSRTETYTNAPSQFRFPPRVGGFDREEVKQYDQQGQDVGVGYNHQGQGIAITVFVYPVAQRAPDDTLGGHFSTCKADVLAGHSGARLVSEEPTQISIGGVQRSGQRATFTCTEMFAHKQQAVRSELFVFTHGQRFIKYRATFPVGEQAAAEPAVRAFIEELAWP